VAVEERQAELAGAERDTGQESAAAVVEMG
jgi:hypothetical protein